MRPWVTVTIITVIAAVVTFALGPVIWPMLEGGPGPQGAQLPLLIIVGVLESVAFGLGVAFAVRGWPVVKRIAAPSRGSAIALYVCVIWFLVSWWPHDRMHMSNAADNWWRLIAIEYVFHVSLIVAGIVSAYCFFDILRHHPKAE